MNRLRFSANLGFLWPECPLPQRIHAAAGAGFDAVELHWPYDTAPSEVRDALNATGVVMLSLNTPPGDQSTGDFGLGAVPGREKEAQDGVCRAVDYACAVGAASIHTMAGICEDSRIALHRMYDHLAWAAQVARAAGISILIEPINHHDRPGYALSRISQCIDLIHRLELQEDIRNIRLIFDCYHVQMTEGNLLSRLCDALPQVGHIQIAGVPGRQEPTNCEIDYTWLFGAIANLDYRGWIGAEYLPAGRTDAGLDWHRPYRSTEPYGPLKTPRTYLNYTQDTLDREYDNRRKVADFQHYLQRYRRRSRETRKELGGTLDVSYGPSSEEILDIFHASPPEMSHSLRPVHVFFHGGYWHALDKDDFSYVANAIRRSEALCVVVNYALIPEVDMDELVAQCRQSLIWLWHHAPEYGGDPSRIVLSGHSAGGHLAAMMSATDWSSLDPGCPGDLVKGVLSISGLMDLAPIRLCYLNRTLNLDQDMTDRNSPILLENRSGAELVCVHGDQEGAEYRRQSESLSVRWDHSVSISLPGENHFSIAMMLDRPDNALSGVLHTLIGNSGKHRPGQADPAVQE